MGNPVFVKDGFATAEERVDLFVHLNTEGYSGPKQIQPGWRSYNPDKPKSCGSDYPAGDPWKPLTRCSVEAVINPGEAASEELILFVPDEREDPVASKCCDLTQNYEHSRITGGASGYYRVDDDSCCVVGVNLDLDGAYDPFVGFGSARSCLVRDYNPFPGLAMQVRVFTIPFRDWRCRYECLVRDYNPFPGLAMQVRCITVRAFLEEEVRWLQSQTT